MVDKILLALFVGSFAIVWMSTVGYVLILRLLVFLNPKTSNVAPDYPEIAVVIPTLNEEAGILDKIDDVGLSDYPQDRMHVIVVDGGSKDRTVEFVKREISRGKKIKLICLNQSRGKVDQINHILTNPGEDIIVFTDADSRLEPPCIRELVHCLTSDPATAMVGAKVKPKSSLLEERIHWIFLNYIWWLEGEIFSSAGISGVCYAVNRNIFLSLAQDAIAEDIHLGLDISARGYRVRICREAVAHELRVPQTPQEFVRFRRRRGASYVNELVHSQAHTDPPIGWEIAKFVRLWQFSLVGWFSLIMIASACFLAATRHWMFIGMLSALMLVSIILQVFFLSNHSEKRPGFFVLCKALVRFSILLLVSLLSLNKNPTLLGPLGGNEEGYDNSPTA
ncbi:MAG: glycosyltransferase [Candidatus Aminicenantes bacterium]|nr:glycosyltransferase [Candidatus Aminicenantes bacterium]